MLKEQGLEHADLKLRMIMSDLLNIPRLELELHREKVLSKSQLRAFDQRMVRLRNQEPVQYIIGSTSFMGLSIQCDQRGLIPRPETELLCDHVLKDSCITRQPTPTIIDVGTGTGCIALALAHFLPKADVIGIDSSFEALKLANENKEALGLRHVKFQQGHLLDDIEPQSAHAVVANLPYISKADYENLPGEVKNYEPHGALCAEDEGFADMFACVESTLDVLRSGGGLFLEIGESQAAILSAHLHTVGFIRVQVMGDLAGRDRIVYGYRT